MCLVCRGQGAILEIWDVFSSRPPAVGIILDSIECLRGTVTFSFPHSRHLDDGNGERSRNEARGIET